MREEIKVPAMGESITEAVIGSILKPSGSKVEAEDELLELETDKVNQVLYSPASGVVAWSVDGDDTVAIGQVIGVVDTEAKQAAESSEPEKPKPTSAPQMPEPEKPLTQQEEPKQGASGARLSKEAAIEKIRTPEKKEPASEEREVRTPKKAAPTSKEGRRETRTRMPKIRKLIAKRLVEVQQNTAMLTTFNEIDLSNVIAARNKNKDHFIKEHGVKLGFMSFFVKATVSALKLTPLLNATIDGDEIVQRHSYDIGIAVGTEKGLIVPVIRDCEQLTFAEIEQAIADFASKARERRISVDDLQGGGFTITNGGVYGSLLSTPILNPPQSGILGMHKILHRPIAVDNQVIICPMMYVALSYDHRIIDGKEAVTFLVHLKNYLEDPTQLLLET